MKRRTFLIGALALMIAPPRIAKPRESAFLMNTHDLKPGHVVKMGGFSSRNGNYVVTRVDGGVATIEAAGGNA